MLRRFRVEAFPCHQVRGYIQKKDNYLSKFLTSVASSVGSLGILEEFKDLLCGERGLISLLVLGRIPSFSFN